MIVGAESGFPMETSELTQSGQRVGRFSVDTVVCVAVDLVDLPNRRGVGELAILVNIGGRGAATRGNFSAKGLA